MNSAHDNKLDIEEYACIICINFGYRVSNLFYNRSTPTVVEGTTNNTVLLN